MIAVADPVVAASARHSTPRQRARWAVSDALTIARRDYVNYLMPGIIAQSAAFASFSTAIGLAREVQRGVIDRFRSMPMARSAVLAGRLLADTIRLTLTVLIITAVGYAVGFRFENGVIPAVFMIVLGVLFGVMICCVAAFVVFVPLAVRPTARSKPGRGRSTPGTPARGACVPPTPSPPG